MAVGETIQLAPRDPNPDASYGWRVRDAPASSRLELGEGAVVDFAPDASGRYVVELDAPDGTHRLTIRVFRGGLVPVGAGAGTSGASGASGFQSGSARPTRHSGGVSGSGSGAGSGGERGGGRPRIQLHGSVEGDEAVVRADPRPHPDGDAAPDDLVVEFLVDDRDDVDESDVEVSGWELRVPLSAVGDRLRVHAVAVGDSYSVPDSVEFARDAVSDGGEPSEARRVSSETSSDGGEPSEARRVSSETSSDVVRVTRPNDPPEWATEATLYEIYVRGFASDEGAESTFEAIENRLDYLDELGVDCLWLTPVLQNDHAPHGYNITNFFEIASDLGTREDYERFVDAAHDRGMKVLFDLVLNHSARDHPYFRDAYGTPDSEYYDWYEWREDGEPGTYFDWEYIANFNYENLAVRRHLLDAADRWSEIADGFRCDMAWAVPNAFWRELRDRLKSRDPDFLLLDETIPYVADFHGGMFDMHFDTTLYFTMRQVGRGHEPAEAVLDAVDQRAAVGFPPHASFMLYVENHDETRYIVECGDDAAMAAAGALFTLPGVPMLYGGQELGQRGRRDALAWDRAREEIRDHYRRLIEVRNETPALGYRGAFRRVDYESDAEEAVAFARELDGERYVCVLNFGADAATVAPDVAVDPTDVVSGDDLATEGGLRVESVAVFRAE
jgi:glycosidase